MSRTILYTIDERADEGERADVVLGRRIPALSRRQARCLAREGKLRIDGRRQPPSTRVQFGQTLELHLDDDEQPPTPELDVLAITERYIYVHKPAGLHTVALTPDQPGVLATAVARRWPECASASEDPREGGAVHRLDQPTSGVVAFARSRASWLAARAAFKTARVAKHYLAVCERVTECWPPKLPEDGLRGWIETTRVAPLTELASSRSRPVDPAEFADYLVPLIGDQAFEPPLESVRIRAAIGREGQTRSAVRLDGRRASTLVQPLAARHTERGERWLVRLLLETGCRHQARVHLAWIGLPIVDDPVYGTFCESAGVAIRLHAFAIDLSAAAPDEVLVFAPPPEF